MLKVVFDTNVIVSAALYEKSLPALLLSLDTYTIKSENLSLRLWKSPVETPLPTVGGDEGEGDQFCPPPPLSSPVEGGGYIGEISNMFG